MSSEKEKMPDVRLSAFRFTNQQPPLVSTNDIETIPDGRHPSAETAGSNNQTTTNFRSPEAYAQMAADKLGQELAREAGVWKLYLEEANDHDQELVKGRHSSLDMLLLFAALFSAILTAFLIESKELLQQDPADASLALLLLIAQSQYRVERGLPPLEDEPSPTVPNFAPPMAARWVNGIWFTSLGLSLSAALVAMLGKEWLSGFLASRPRPAHDHALLRQSRLEGLEQWWALHIIALLPSLLHASLLLFAIGLVIYLWTLDTAIAAVLLAIIGSTTLFYLVTATLGAVYEFCPFVTEISEYVRRALVALLGRKSVVNETASRHATLQDIRAVLWLANHSRDPAVVDCSYQALAGLHRPSEAAHELPVIPRQLDEDITTTSLLATMINRFELLTVGSLYVTSVPESSSARYLNAILALAAHVRHLPPDESQHISAEFLGIEHPAESRSAFVGQITHTGLPISPSRLLSMTEHLWDNETFQFSADTYTALLTAEMEIVQLAVSYLGNTTDNHQASDRPPLINTSSTVAGNTHIIDFALLDSTPPADPKLSDLRAHYSRWLARVSGILSLHANETITISFPLLESLLHALASAAACSILNPPESVSTHHPQSNSIVGNRNYRFIIASSKNQSYTLSSDDLRMGPLGSLVDLLRKRPSFQDEATVQTCAVILKAYSVLAPVLLQQTLKLDRLELQEAFDMSKWPHTPKSNMSGMKYIATRQALLSLRYLALSRTTNARHYAFLVDVLKLMNVCYSHDKISKSKSDSYLALLQHSDDLVPMLEFAGESRSNIKLLPRDAMFHFLNIAQLWTTNQRVTPCESAFTPACFPVLLSMVRYAKFPEHGVEELLQAMIRRIRSENSSYRENSITQNPTPAIQYLLCFTRSDRGFSSLARAVRPGNPISKPIVIGITELTRIAVNRDPQLAVDPVELSVLAVPGFMDSMSVVAKHCSRVAEHYPMLLEFSTNALVLLKAACSDATSKDLVARHSACHKLRSALLQVQGDASVQGLAAQLHEIAARPRAVIQEPAKSKSMSGKTRELGRERTNGGTYDEPGVSKPKRTTKLEIEQALESDDNLGVVRSSKESPNQNESDQDSLQEDGDNYV